MSSRTTKWDVPFSRKKHERWIKEGRGQGVGADYRGWIQYGDFSSLGNTARHKESRHGRMSLALSELEQKLLTVLESNPNVVAIYDQVPLDLDRTQAIATDLGFPHPKAQRSNYPFVMTSDFVVDLKTPGGVIKVPFQAKYVCDLGGYSEYHKLEIERLYWLERGMKLRIVTETTRCLPAVLVANAKSIQQFRFAPKAEDEDPSRLTWVQRCDLILNAVRAATAPETLNEIADRLALHTASPMEDFTGPILHLIFKAALPCDLYKPHLLKHDVLEIQERIRAIAAKAGAQ